MGFSVKSQSTGSDPDVVVNTVAFGTTPNANGGDISGVTLTLEPASVSYPGGVSILSQEFTGNKNFLTGLSAQAIVGGIAVAALATPVNATFATATTGGSLAAGTYYYRVAATNAAGSTVASTETSKVVPAGTSTNTVTVNWAAITGATGYKVYGRSTGAELLMATITSGLTTTWLDTGAVTPSGALPTATSANSSMAGDLTLAGALTVNTSISSAGNIATAGILFINSLIYSNSAAGYCLLTGYVDTGDTGVRSNVANGATAIGVKVSNNATLSTAGAQIMGWYPDNGGTKVAALDKDGSIQLNISGAAKPAAAAGNRGKIWVEQGAGGVADVAYVCLKAAGGTYSWVTFATG